MINCHTCSHKCHILRQAISDPRLKSICCCCCCCCSVRVRPSKESSVWVASSSLLVRTTTGSGCDYWQTTSHIITAPGSNTCQWMCDQHAFLLPFCSLPSMSKSEFMKAAFIFALCFCLLLWGCGACVTQSMLEGSWRGIWKSTLSAIQTRDHTNPLDPFGILVCTLWHRHAHIIYTLGYITQTNLSAHTTAKKATHAQDRLWSHNRALLF